MTQSHSDHRVAEQDRLSKTLIDIVERHTQGRHAVETAIPGLHLSRWEHPTEPTSYTMGASVCLIAQGRKRVMLGEDAYEYDANRYLVTSVDLPVVAQIQEATQEAPYLGVMLGLDHALLAQLIVDSNLPVQAARSTGRGIGVSELSLPITRVFIRLLELLDSPADVAILAPLIKKELFYHLLVGPQAGRLRQLVLAGSHGHQITQTIAWLKTNFREQTTMDELADQAHMSRSSFYQHFRNVTSLSPLQYRKHLRLQEARRLMVVENFDSVSAALDVGYESATQFNREYRRLFGLPPGKDAANLRKVDVTSDMNSVLTG